MPETPTGVGAAFISYAREDTTAAQRIAEALRASGVEVWFDQNELRGGEAWDAAIRKQIKDCTLFLPIISASTQARTEGYFRLEWRLADQRTHLMGRSRSFIVPVCVDATSETKADVPDSFLSVHWTRLPAGETPPAFGDRIKSLMRPTASPWPSVPTPTGPEPAGAAAAKGDRDTSAPGPRPVGKIRRAALAGLAALVMASLIWLVAHYARPKSAPTQSVAVLAFDDASPGGGNAFYSDGISAELMVVLGRVPGLRVVAWTSAFFFKKSGTTPEEIGRRLEVEHLVTGTVQRDGDIVRIFAHLIRAATGEQIWSERYERNAKDAFAIEDEIARDIAQKLRLQLGAATAGSQRKVDPEAFRLVAEGRHFWSHRTAQGSVQAEAGFLQALGLDADFAQAHSGLADVYLIRGLWELTDGRSTWVQNMRRARESAERAHELDPDLAEPIATLGYVSYYTGDPGTAQALLKKAIALNPNLLSARGYYAVVLAAEGFLDRSLEQGKVAVELDPLSAINLAYYANSLYAANRATAALPFARRAFALSQDKSKAISVLFTASVFLTAGARDEALAAARGVMREDRIDVTGAFISVNVLRKAGLEAEAMKHTRLALAQLPPTDYRYGLVLVAAGRFAEALSSLEQTPATVWGPNFFWYDMWDPYRDDPRFHALLAKLGLTEQYKASRATLEKLRPGKKA